MIHPRAWGTGPAKGRGARGTLRSEGADGAGKALDSGRGCGRIHTRCGKTQQRTHLERAEEARRKRLDSLKRMWYTQGYFRANRQLARLRGGDPGKLPRPMQKRGSARTIGFTVGARKASTLTAE
jgi:hypothetical protein